MTKLAAIPPEVVEQIVLLADPLDLSAFSRTSSLYHSIINNQRLWQALYLTQSLDDPRTCQDLYGRSSFPVSASSFDWKGALQRIIRARKVIQARTLWSKDRISTLQTLLHLITNIPATTSLTESISLNLAWVAALLQNSIYLDVKLIEDGPEGVEEDQLRARIHCCFGLTKLDLGQMNQTNSRAYVYDMRVYRGETDFGPFMLVRDDEEGIDDVVDPFQAFPVVGRSRKLVNWVHVQAIHHVMSMHIVKERLEELGLRYEKGTSGEDEDELKDFAFVHYPMSLPYCQSVIPEGFDLDTAVDWAGVEGMWKCYFCYFDHRELMLFNRYGMSGQGPLDASIFEQSSFREVVHTLIVDIHITEAESDPLHPTRPKLHFAGDDPATLLFSGWVGYRPDDQIQWYFEYGENGEMTWSSSGIQVGAVRSPFGVVGGWTAVNHNHLSPVGPFWFHKVNDAIVQQLDEVESDNESID